MTLEDAIHIVNPNPERIVSEDAQVRALRMEFLKIVERARKFGEDVAQGDIDYTCVTEVEDFIAYLDRVETNLRAAK